MIDKDNMTIEEMNDLIDCIEDMYSDKGHVSWAAREYYIKHYADNEEARKMKREDTVSIIVSSCIWVAVIGGGITTIILRVFG